MPPSSTSSLFPTRESLVFHEDAGAMSVKKYQTDFLHWSLGGNKRFNRFRYHGRSLFRRIAKRACRDGRERDRAQIILRGQCKRIAVTRCQHCSVGLVSGFGGRTNGVNYIAARQMAGRGEHRCTHRQPLWESRAPDLAAFFQNLRSAHTVNRAIHAASAQKRAIRRVYDGVNSLPGDVTYKNTNSAGQETIRCCRMLHDSAVPATEQFVLQISTRQEHRRVEECAHEGSSGPTQRAHRRFTLHSDNSP